MLGISFLELFFLFILALILFGPKDLPKLARLLLQMVYRLKNIFHQFEKKWNHLEDKEKNDK